MKQKVNGKILQVTKNLLGQVSYQIGLEHGEPIVLSKDKIVPHPKDRPLISGTPLEVVYKKGVLAVAHPIQETDQVTIKQIQKNQNMVVVTGKLSGSNTIRVAPEEAQDLRVGEEVRLEIQYQPDGRRVFVLTRLQGQPAAPAKGPAKAAQPPAQPGPKKPAQPVQTRPSAEAPQPAPVTTPPAARIQAEAFGIDPLQLEQVKRDGHRFEIIQFLEKHAQDGLIEWYDMKKGRAANYQQPARPLHPLVKKAIGSTLPGFNDFFKHQALALDAIRANRNVVIVTQTASGKTLSYNPAIFEYLLNDPGGHVLYIFPLNALMMDQLDKVQQLVQALAAENVTVTAAKMMGGMKPAEREAIARECPNIVVTNPEMLQLLLDNADGDWQKFFTRLKLIVVDEVHSYRGIFGLHMTGILRRLLLTARRLGADPRFVISSATIHNPLDLAARLTALPEQEFVLLSPEKDGSQQADKHWLVLNPDWGTQGSRYNNYQEVAADVFVEMLLSHDRLGKPAPLNTILFCRSMREVRAIKNLVDQRLQQKSPGLLPKVRSYISAALTTEVKSEIYNGLRSGDLLGVISTNALEAGIDIGSLDACIIAGFPFSVMALRQMAGRVGRKKEGVVCFVPFPLSSLDQYYSDHPELLLTQPPEEFVVDPQNPYIARKHINATAVAQAIPEADLRRYWGERAVEIVRQAERDGIMQRQGDRWMGTRRNYHAQDDPYLISNIRSNAQRPFVVCQASTGTCEVRAECFDPNKKPCSSRVTLLDQQYVYRDCHPGAIYESPDQGLFRASSLNEERRQVTVRSLADGNLERTFADTNIDIELNGAPRGKKTILPGVDMGWGDATVKRLYTGYHQFSLRPARRCRRCRKEYGDQVQFCPDCHHPVERFYEHSKPEQMEFPAPYQKGFSIQLKTIACWLTIQSSLAVELEACSPCALPGDQNRVLDWVRAPLNLKNFRPRLRISEAEKTWISSYYQEARDGLAQVRPTAREKIVFPGLYGKCLLAALRGRTSEDRTLELYEAVTGYPVTSDSQQPCRACKSAALYPAIHTLEHAVDARYPSVALGDRSDIGALTIMGHIATGLPTIFWFDNYEGGLGAAEKIFELIPRLMETGLNAIQRCSCTTIEGCPRCTYTPDCAEGNEKLSKPAGILLLSKLLGREVALNLEPFIYKK